MWKPGDRIRFKNERNRHYYGKTGVVVYPTNDYGVVTVLFDDMNGLTPGTSTALATELEAIHE